MNINDWYSDTVRNDSVNRVSQRSGIAQTTLNGQVKSGHLKPETVVAVANAYGKDALDALVVSGLITREQIRQHGVRQALSAATDRQIADEVWTRLNDGAEHATFDEPVAPASTVSHLSLVSEEPSTVPIYEAAKTHGAGPGAEQDGGGVVDPHNG